MRKTIMGLILVLFGFTLYSQSPAQKAITQQEAKEIFQKTVWAINDYDTAAFISLWHLDNSKPWFNWNREYDKSDIIEEFKTLQNFLVVPLVKELPFERIEITHMGAGFLNTYKIKAYFKIDDHLQLGYGFLTDYVGGRWALRWHGETTVSPNN